MMTPKTKSSTTIGKPTGPKHATAPRSKTHPLEYFDEKTGEWVSHSELKIADECKALSQLSDNAFNQLRQSICPANGGGIYLQHRIEIDDVGRIVDGRHRAMVLVQCGEGDTLVAEIEALLKHAKNNPRQNERPKTKYVRMLPKGTDLSDRVTRVQLGRRNAQPWEIARRLLSEYRSIVASSKPGRKSSDDEREMTIDDYCSSVGVAPRTFQKVQLIDKYTPELWDTILDRGMSFADALKQAKAIKKGQPHQQPAKQVKITLPDPTKADRIENFCKLIVNHFEPSVAIDISKRIRGFANQSCA